MHHVSIYGFNDQRNIGNKARKTDGVSKLSESIEHKSTLTKNCLLQFTRNTSSLSKILALKAHPSTVKAGSFQYLRLVYKFVFDSLCLSQRKITRGKFKGSLGFDTILLTIQKYKSKCFF